MRTFDVTFTNDKDEVHSLVTAIRRGEVYNRYRYILAKGWRIKSVEEVI